MSERLKQLQDLEVQLHEINQEFVRSARPLDWLSELNDQQRCQLADQLRIRQARWESVTQQILKVLGNGSGPCVFLQDATKEDRGE